MVNILEVTKLNKAYNIGKDTTQYILKDIDLQIRQGEFVSIMGPSGCGKSTLLYTISGMDNITSGTVRFCNKEVSMMSEDALSKLRLFKMGFIFQECNLLRNLNIYDNIILPAYQAKIEKRTTINKRAKQLMEKTGIETLGNHTITNVSGGELQRAAICRSLINKPQIIFGDEPTGALNSKAAHDIMKLLLGINQSGTTVLVVTHDIRVAAKTERVIYLSDGVIIGEKYLNKYAKESCIKTREKQLTAWLLQKGF